MASAPPPPPPAPAAPVVETASPLPAFAYFTETYAFYTDDGMSYSKQEGQYETNAPMIAKLIERKAPILTTQSEIDLFKIQMADIQRKRAMAPNPWA